MITLTKYLESLAVFTENCSKNIGDSNKFLELLVSHYKKDLQNIYENSTLGESLKKSFERLYYEAVKPSLIEENENSIDTEKFSASYLNFIMTLLNKYDEFLKDMDKLLERMLVIDIAASLVALYLKDINEYPYI